MHIDTQWMQISSFRLSFYLITIVAMQLVVDENKQRAKTIISRNPTAYPQRSFCQNGDTKFTTIRILLTEN